MKKKEQPNIIKILQDLEQDFNKKPIPAQKYGKVKKKVNDIIRYVDQNI